MTLICSDEGNMFNAELLLEVEHDVEEVKLLAKELLKQRNMLLNKLRLLDTHFCKVDGAYETSNLRSNAMSEVDVL